MLKILCGRCQKELREPGALLFSPPMNKVVLTFHLCVECFDVILKTIKEARDE